MNKKIWVVVADSARARMFNADMPDSSLDELPNLLHQAGRSKGRDLLSDSTGRANNSDHTGSHTTGHEKDIKQQEAITFAREISQKLNTAYHQQQIRRLYLLTPPHMLGLLRKQLSQEVRSVISQESSLNLVNESPVAIRSHLPKRL